MIMHRFGLIGLALSALSMLPLEAAKDFLDSNEQSYSGFQVDTEAVLPAKEVHPSLWFTAQELVEFKATLDADSIVQGYWEKVRNHSFLSSPFPEMVPDDALWIPELAKTNIKKIHKYYGDMTQIPAYCGFMVWMTDDPELKQQYLERAKAALLRAFDGPIFELDPTKSGVDKSVDEIYHAVWAQSICAGYDFVQPFLTPEEDLLIRERILKEARFVHKHLDSWSIGPHNHLSKPAWGLATLALTFSDEPEAKDWFRHAMEAANQNTHYFFSADGIYREGGMYYLFSWLNYVPFLYHYKNVSGVDYFGDFQSSFEWGVLGRNARGWIMNTEDSFLRPVPTQMVSKAFQNHESFLAPGIPFSEVLQWNFLTTDYGPFEEAEESSGFNYTGASWDYPMELYDLITYDPSIPGQAPTADPTIFMEGGQTIFRNSWLNEPELQSYLLFHCVPQADNHDHHDTLSYILYAKNQMMASDSGYTPNAYGDASRYIYYRRPQAHNTITWDDIPLGDFVENQPNPSEDRLNTSFFDFEKKTAPFRLYLGQIWGTAQRSIAFIQNEYFLVLDEVGGLDYNGGIANGGGEVVGKIDLYFHGGRGTVEADGNSFLWSYEADQYGDAAQLLTYQLAPGAEIEVLSMGNTYIKKDAADFPTLRTTKAADKAVFGQILYPLGPGDERPVIEDYSTDRLLVAKVITQDKTDLLLKSRADVVSSAQGVYLDGEFTWIRTVDDSVTEVAGQSILNLSYKGEAILSSDQRISFALKKGPVFELGVAAENPARVMLFLDQPITTVTSAGKEIPFELIDGTLVLEMSESGIYLIQ